MNIAEVENEIKRLEASDTSYPNCSRLAVLYSVRDHHGVVEAKQEKAEYSFDQSEFMRYASSVPLDKLLSVMDEHMSAVSVLYPKEYSAILRKLKE